MLASVLFGERLGKRGVAALLVGVAGLLLLEVPEEQGLLTQLVVEGQEERLEEAAQLLAAAPGARSARLAHSCTPQRAQAGAAVQR